MKAQERLPELAHCLGDLWEVELWGPDPCCLLDVLVVSADRDPVLVCLGKFEDCLGVRQEPVEGPAKKLARSDAAVKIWSRICDGISA